MTNFKKTVEISIRLPKQATLPKPDELISMAHEARRSKKRIELPWQPEGRPHPALISVFFDEKVNKSTWMIHHSHHSEAKVEWTDVDPDPTKVVLALRDWYQKARATEGWTTKSAAEPAGYVEPPPQPAEIQPPPVPMVPPGMQQNYPPPNPAYPNMPQPYPQTPGGVPVWTGYPQQPGYAPYPPYPYAVPPAPPHWAQSAPPAPGPGQPVPQQQQPLAPELWALHTSSAPSAPTSPKLGDLLVAAGVLPTRTLQAALTLQNTGNVEKRRIGEILVSTGAVPANVLEAAVKLQDMAREGSITNQRVTELLRQLSTTGAKLDDLFRDKPTVTIKPRADQLLEDEEAKITHEERAKVSQVLKLLKEADLGNAEAADKCDAILELLSKATILSEDTLQAELASNKNNPVDTVKALLVKEVVDPTTFEAALACQKLIQLERFKVEQAVIALGYCSRSRVSLKDAISDLNWLIPMDGI
jgi:hypothetical protein